ncbi:energy transducer TonB [Flavobacterium sp. N1736]|uniref:energy transducer TonB n=1 Tax=Flavobacterium sp. N1736 TaxID=2986823 RepID=UPI00222409B0|nr:energy transducer TonB [Flavobacterium sp. N1736]
MSKEEIIDKLEKGGPEVVEINLFAEKYKAIKAENGIYKTADLIDKPTYPGGMQEFYKFVGKNFKVPKTPDNVLLKGKIFVSFIVQKDGSLSDLKVLKDLGFSTGEEALRVLKLSQNWIPGKLDGKPVAAQYSLPISIQSAD